MPASTSTWARLDALLALAEQDAAGGLGDAPWPPHFPKGDDEPVRVNPSRAKKIAEWEEMKRQGLGGDRGQGSQGRGQGRGQGRARAGTAEPGSA